MKSSNVRKVASYITILSAALILVVALIGGSLSVVNVLPGVFFIVIGFYGISTLNKK